MLLLDELENNNSRPPAEFSFTDERNRKFYTVEDVVEDHLSCGWFSVKVFFICGLFSVRLNASGFPVEMGCCFWGKSGRNSLKF